MLYSLHVKNLALIDEVEVEFGRGLNILTGETGAGKSIIIGSVNLALGGKAQSGFVRDNGEPALVELIFTLDNEEQRRALKDLGILQEDDQVIMQRRLSQGKSVGRVNGETVTMAVMRAVAEVLIDIHGQHEHQALLYKKKHLELLDAYCGAKLSALKDSCLKAYREYTAAAEEMSKGRMDEAGRERERSYLEFQAGEIEAAALKPGEDEELEQLFRRMTNSRKIVETMSEVYGFTGYERTDGAGENIGRSLRSLRSAAELDETLSDLAGQLEEIDNLLNDFNRSVADYMSEMNYSEQDFEETEKRLNQINELKSKYGPSLEQILAYREDCLSKLRKLDDYDSYMAELEKKKEKAFGELKKICAQISGIRLKQAGRMEKEIVKALKDLNFLDARFAAALRSDENKCGPAGWDEVEFMISTNPGEKLKPLAEVASGGELSRIMLAMKTVLADQDEIGTLIFDEIDVGISGRTAQKVSEKLAVIAGRRQVICITHLPQIAAMADRHFLIEKKVINNSTRTQIGLLEEEETVGELARLLSGARVTDAVLKNAKEMKELAAKTKK